MENKAEQIKKALECCHHEGCDNCPGCPYNEENDGTKKSCFLRLMEDSLALIKELTDECANYKSIAEYQQKCNMDRGFEIKRLTEENERLKGAKNE